MEAVHDDISLALDLAGAKPDMPTPRRRKISVVQVTARDQLGVKLNCDLNGYQFQEFSEHYICREELPNGSSTFQQVLDQLSEELGQVTVTAEPRPVPPNPRRKSLASPRYSPPSRAGSRRVRWGSTTVTPVEQGSRGYHRPRVLSDGAITGAKARKAR